MTINKTCFNATEKSTHHLIKLRIINTSLVVPKLLNIKRVHCITEYFLNSIKIHCLLLHFVTIIHVGLANKKPVI